VIDRFAGEYAFLSNFHPLPAAIVEHGDIRYRTVEHAFQAAKTLDLDQRRRIAAINSPAEAKRAGRKVALRPGWDQIRVWVMGELLSFKFGFPQLFDHLLATGDAELVEGNTWGDTFWGVCQGRGENVLGHLLMAIRLDLREMQP
jgi:ribA/ribD-fused uncharacterized protein